VTRGRLQAVAVATFAAAALGVAACEGNLFGLFADDPPPPRTTGDAVTTGLARDALVHLTVAPAGPMDGYDREALFPDWADLDGDGCDTREEVLMRDATEYTRGTGRCVGTMHLEDPYGQGAIESIGNIQIDHVVPLGVAWRSGGRGWTAHQWEVFANDETNLLAVDGGQNMSKGDQTPDEWMPPPSFRCSYAKLYTSTVFRYRLTVTQSTMDVLTDVLIEECPR
jgi:hypothetical protein